MLARSLAVGALVLAGCYDVPAPVCGFACASRDTLCPEGYTCNASDNRCHLDGYVDAACRDVPDDDTDVTAPQLVSWTPRPDLGTATDITVQFDEDVLRVDPSSFFLTDDATDAVFPTTVSNITPAVASLEPTLGLGIDASYTVHLTTAITDRSGNHFAGFEYSFTTAPDAPPQIDFSGFIEPPPDATMAGVDTNVTVTMTELVTTLAGKLRIRDTLSGVEVPSIIDTLGLTQSATLDPVDQLQPFTRYSVQVDADVTDTTGNIAGFQMGWTFTTGEDLVAPQIRETTPKANSVAPADTAVAFLFDEPVVSIASLTVSSGATALSGTLTPSSDRHVWTFALDASLPPNTVIDVALTGAADAAGNVRNFVYNFTTSP